MAQARIPPGQGFSVCRFVGLWVCGLVVLRGRAVRCQTKLHVVLWGCGVVVCVCVCFIGRVGPKKLQKSASFANFYQNRTKIGPKSTTNGTNLDHGGGEGATENRQKYEIVQKTQTERSKIRKNVVFEIWCDFLKNRRDQRLGVY